MFNLLVKAMEEAWEGEPYNTFELTRSVREYTDPEITARYGDLGETSVAALLQLPSVFAYERPMRLAPRLGRLTAIQRMTNRQEVRVEYELFDVPFLSNDQLWDSAADLDIGRWEENRSHWAVKAIDIGRVLARHGLALPPAFANALAPAARVQVPVNVTTHVFDVAFSFPGQYRPTVEAVVRETTALLGADSCFYDFNYQAQLARPALDVLLQDLYSTRARLIVVFLGTDYQTRPWPNIEWNAIRGILNARAHDQIMFVKMDEGRVDGVQAHDGYLDAQRFSPAQIAGFIAQRVWLLPAR